MKQWTLESIDGKLKLCINGNCLGDAIHYARQSTLGVRFFKLYPYLGTNFKAIEY